MYLRLSCLILCLIQHGDSASNKRAMEVDTGFWSHSKLNSHSNFSAESTPIPMLRLKRYIGTNNIFFKETELGMRERISLSYSQLMKTGLLPKFGGKDSLSHPYTNLIQVLSHTRSYRDGPLAGQYVLTTADTVAVSVDPVVHRLTKGKWTIYAGSREQRCLPQAIFGNGYKAIFSCSADGTYHAFFRAEAAYKDEHDTIDGVSFRPPEVATYFFDVPNFSDHFLAEHCDAAADLTLSNFWRLMANPQTILRTFSSLDEFPMRLSAKYALSNPANHFEKNISCFRLPSSNHVMCPRLALMDYETKLLQDEESLTKPWYFSDPIKIARESYCYRWNYRLIKVNEVGFIHQEPNPLASAGVYKEYVLKVWIVDPAEVREEELNSQTHMYPGVYSKTITRKFYLAGLVPCLRYAHKAVEVISDANYVAGGDTKGINWRHDSARLYGPHWSFRIKVHMDKVVSTLSDIVFIITPRQHSALYECFIAEIRVYLPPRSYVFLPKSKVSERNINLQHSSVSTVQLRFLKENVANYYGYDVVYVGPPHIKDKSLWVPVFPNPCINQEMVLSWNGTLAMTSDFCARNDLQRMVLPSFQMTRMGLRVDKLRLSMHETKLQMEMKNNESYIEDDELSIKIVDFAYTPADLIFLIDDSSIYLHSNDLSLKGIGFNTLTQKYKLGSFVRRRWCARTSTPKSHNMWVPAFSRDHGSLIIIYHVPAEGACVIKQAEANDGCETTRDSMKFGKNEESWRTVSEEEIHKDEADDARIDRAVEAKLRTKAAEIKALKRESAKTTLVHKTKADLADEKTFWLAGPLPLEGSDPHYLSGATDAMNVRIATSALEDYNDNIIFQLESNFKRTRHSFEINGLSFAIDESVYANGFQLEREAPNKRLFSLHAVEFTGVEKRYLLAVGFQSQEFPKTMDQINSTLVVVCTFLAHDLPVVLNRTFEKEVELEDVDVVFSGTIIRRSQSLDSKDTKTYNLKESDFYDSQGREVKPAPLSKDTSRVYSVNTALPVYVIRINDLIIYSSLDGSFVKPILCYENYPTPEQDAFPKPFFPFNKFDVVVTEVGIISVLSRKQYSKGQAATASEAFIGSVLGNEPLRYIHPFHLSNDVFQVATEEGEIVYGRLSYNDKTGFLDSPPKTEMLNVPFWSFLKGSFARSAGETNIPLDRQVHSLRTVDSKNYADPICPFASFDVYYVVFPYVEAQYTTRITAEVAFYGDVIPLEADVIVEFSEVQGVSVVVASFLEVEYDQTIVRKTIEIESFLPEPQLHDMYNRHHSVQSDDETITKEEVRVFTLTIRPSVLNLHCDKKNYFKTIQMNVGCVPLTHMRLLAETLPLKKISVHPWRVGLAKDDLEKQWYHDDTNSKITGISHLVIPRDALHYSQRKTFGCERRNQTYCRLQIPAGKGIDSSVYGLSFRDTLVPKFEQFLTQHARRVTGNIVMYDILDSYKDDQRFQIEANTTQYNAQCLVDDGNWYEKMAEKANFYNKELTLKSDIYRYFNNCFSRLPSFKLDERMKLLPTLSIQELNNRTFFLFNRTNRNALRLKKTRNYVYMFRAVVVNTDYNSFTYCSNLDTFFILQVVNITSQRSPVRWEVYLVIVVFVVAIIVCAYLYFALYKHWRTAIVTNRILQPDTEVEDELQAQLERDELDRMDPVRNAAQKAKQYEHFHQISSQVTAPQAVRTESINMERRPVTMDLLNRRLSGMTKRGNKHD